MLWRYFNVIVYAVCVRYLLALFGSTTHLHYYFVNEVSCVWCGCADLNWQLRICVDVLQSVASELLFVFRDSLSSCIKLSSSGCIGSTTAWHLISGFLFWMPQSASLMASASVVDAVDGRPGIKYVFALYLQLVCTVMWHWVYSMNWLLCVLIFVTMLLWNWIILQAL